LALVVPELRGGGAERVHLDLARGFVDRGHDVRLIVGARTGELAAAVDPRCHMVELGVRRVGAMIPQLARYLRSDPPDALLSTMTHMNTAVLIAARLSTRRRSFRIGVIEQSSLSQRMDHGTSWKTRALYALAHRAYADADAVVACSHGVAIDLERRFHLHDRLHVIYNPVDGDRARRLALDAIPTPWDSQAFVLAVGRLVPEKGFDLLLRAHALLSGPDAPHLVILGDGPERSALEGLARQLGTSSSVWMPGFVTNPFAWMTRAQALVLSSRREGLPTVLVEALAIGAPIAAVNCEWGPSEILDGGLFGQLVPPGDDVGLAQAMTTAIAEGRLPEAVARRRARAEVFSLPSAIRSYELLLVPDQET
jgi:glycosyltransferase involved in cell wall biosynthesis